MSTMSLLANPPPTVPIPPSLRAKMAAVANANANAQNRPAVANPRSISEPQVPRGHSTAARGRARPKPNMFLSDFDPIHFGGGPQAAGLRAPIPNGPRLHAPVGTPFSAFSRMLDASGALNVGGTQIHASGVIFSNGRSYSMAMKDLQIEEELGRGNYGTVRRAIHKPTKLQMAMKEIRLELDLNKLESIVRELEILQSASAPNIVEFHGAFTVESCVYYLMEYMDAGSLDQLTAFEAGETYTVGNETVVWERVPEDVLARIAGSMVRGLKFLKDEREVMHRDVKPTNVLVNVKGQVKLCDFGVSKQLEKSLAKTNIGCQSYMAPERIHGETRGNLGAYTVAADVWSLGLSVIEISLGKYPYPQESYQNVFAQVCSSAVSR
ncbi:kinase-like protein [Desarmillaria tabescens]|uniref:mitogen-activated protein kinase kinase n=1 Tax=Armillaria tabescens TaxID=1929756 RepID=A0AA39TNS8_ARMTA|nr:kinase-like protein [Desarmillaria tabescens]KAK0461233.1 kinase-like protein [Desarmillaria tabescens]